ncbi:Kinesin-like protein KIF6 isoform X2 [Oopsacas minuta]|uniref:Kinesin-like protein n=1 Tax=Oopsacas minuta TaxID=111878 RepID=A0AAV7KDL7_9METZ|nr:Kinesin-like protein KIF6 isoform X2 [Oopsacas minuta]
MGKIKVYARLKPSSIDNTQINTISNKVLIDKKIINRDRRATNNSQVQYVFDFDSVFDQSISQTDIFQSIAIEALDRFLEGFNCTIFAYGQTGSGKTYTIEGSARRFEDRGLIPRCISYIYDKIKDREDQEISIHISYFEIYNEIGFDLLNPASRLESLLYTGLPKISIRERGDGQFVTHNLTSHLAADEHIAQHLLLQGSLSRKVASTTMNIHSSRSHAVYTILMTSKVIDSDTMTVSKLNFVDLAGSERVAKTGAEGKILDEAKFINKSLHYLEHVIIQLQKAAKSEGPPKKPVRSSTAPGLDQPRAVQEAWSLTISRSKKKYHIPYRNSLLTMFLRDSLGGNCYTFMISTISSDVTQLDETISTCRFAQRVSCIKNIVTRNEILDDKALIKKLRLHIRDLDREICELKKLLDEKNEALRQPIILASQPLSDDDKEVLYKLIRQFLKGEVVDPLEGGLNTREKILESLFFLKEIILQSSKKKGFSIVNVNKPPLPVKHENSKILKQISLENRVEHEIIKERRIVDKESPKIQNYPDILNRVPLQSNKHMYTQSANIENKELSLSAILSRKAVSSSDRNIPFRENTIITPPVKFPGQKSISLPVSPTSQPSIPSSPNVLFFNQSLNKEVSKPPITPESFNKSLHYISPFEQKRRTQIINKIDSLSKSEQSLRNEKSFLLQNQISLELQKNEDKLAIISSTIESQKRRIKYLLQNGNDRGEIENEIIAQRRLETKARELVCKISDLRATNANSAQKSDQNSFKDIPEISSKNTGLILHNLANEERHQHKLKEGIEQIKILQFEQQLELKEAATRRKLLALKQQLKGNITINELPTKSQSLPNTSYSLDREIQNIDSEKIRNGPDSHNDATPNPSSNSEFQFTPQPPSKQRKSEISKPSPIFRIESNTQSKNEINSKPMDITIQKTKIEVKTKISQERAYMSAVQSNRTRVEKIRKVMSAAIVIQRYWRLYKNRTK